MKILDNKLTHATGSAETYIFAAPAPETLLMIWRYESIVLCIIPGMFSPVLSRNVRSYDIYTYKIYSALCSAATKMRIHRWTLKELILVLVILLIHPNWVIIDGNCTRRHGVMVIKVVLAWLVIHEYGWHSKYVTQTTWSHINNAEHSLIYRWISDIYIPIPTCMYI